VRSLFISCCRYLVRSFFRYLFSVVLDVCICFFRL